MSDLNAPGGYALIRASWLSWMQYRSFFFILAFGWMIPPLAAMFVWLAAAGDGGLAGYSRGGFIAYYLILILVNQITYAQSNWTLGDVIREGSLNFWLVRPLPAFWNVLASELAGKVVTLLFVIPVLLLLGFILKPELNPSTPHFLLFVPSLLMAWALRFMWGFGLAALAFWTNRADGLLALQDGLVFLFSGIVAPLVLLPGAMQTIAGYLPFTYMVGAPVDILVRQPEWPEVGRMLLLQSGWVILAFGLCRMIWKFGIRRYEAVGG